MAPSPLLVLDYKKLIKRIKRIYCCSFRVVPISPIALPCPAHLPPTINPPHPTPTFVLVHGPFIRVPCFVTANNDSVN